MVAQGALRSVAPTFSLECQREFLPPRRTRVLTTLPVFKLWDSLTALWLPQGENAPGSKVTALSLLGLSSVGPWGLSGSPSALATTCLPIPAGFQGEQCHLLPLSSEHW